MHLQVGLSSALVDHPQSGVVYNFGPGLSVCLSVAMSVRQ